MDAYKKLIYKVIIYLAPLNTNLTQEIDAMFAVELQFSNVFFYLFQLNNEKFFFKLRIF